MANTYYYKTNQPLPNYSNSKINYGSNIVNLNTRCTTSKCKPVKPIYNPPKPKPVCNPVCDIDVLGSSSGYAPFTAKFSASKSHDRDGSIKEYRWDFGDGSTGSGQSPSHRYNDEGSYDVTLQVKDNGGNYSNICKTKITVYEEENDAPECIIDRTSDREGEAPLRVTFYGSGRDDKDSVSNLRYYWDFGDGDTSTSRNPTHTFDYDDREYRVSLEVEDRDGKKSTNRCEVTVKTKEDKEDIVCDFDIDKIKETSDGAKVYLDASSSDGDIDKYEWRFYDDDDDRVGDESGKEVDHTFKDSGRYTIKLTVKNGDESDSCERNIRINVDEKDDKEITIVKKAEAKTGGDVLGVSSPKTGSDGLVLGLAILFTGLFVKALLLAFKKPLSNI